MDAAIRNRLLNCLRVLGVRVKAYSLVDIKREKARGLVQAVIFSKGEELVEAACMLLINCTNPCLVLRVARVLDRADLVYLQVRGAGVLEGRSRSSHISHRSSRKGTGVVRVVGVAVEVE